MYDLGLTPSSQVNLSFSNRVHKLETSRTSKNKSIFQRRRRRMKVVKQYRENEKISLFQHVHGLWFHINGERWRRISSMRHLSDSSLKPSLLKRHFCSYHPDLKDKDITFFKRKDESLKRIRLDNEGHLYRQNKFAVHASYLVSYQVAKAKKPHTIAEDLILPSCKDIVHTMLGEESVKKLNPISLSYNTVQRRISEISIKEQVILEIKEAPLNLFSIQLDESTCIQLCTIASFCQVH